jgi:deazaflavin-dependent oxidoreductase (nitroreductase family)
MGLGALAIVAAVIIAQEKLFYRDRRPTRGGRALNRWWARAYGSGLLPSWLVSLETVGRRSGQRRLNALVRADYGGQQYLVSMLGHKAEWARNARAREGAATIRHGQRTQIKLEEVPVDERAPILKAYLSRARGARRHFSVRHDASMEMFNAVASDYPVFRILPGSPGLESKPMTAESVASR